MLLDLHSATTQDIKLTIMRNRTKKGDTNAQERFSQAWLDLISNAGKQAANARSEDTLLKEIQVLETARDYLEARRQHWHRVPGHAPRRIFDSDGVLEESEGLREMTPSQIMVPSQTIRTSTTVFANKNPFAIFGEDDDDSDSEDSLRRAEEKGPEDNVDSSGHIHLEPEDDNGKLMTMRRLLIRILTTLSELHARITNLRRRERDASYWTDGVERYTMAANCLQMALNAADEEYARLFVNQENAALSHSVVQQESQSLRMQQLADDAEVVMIAIDFFGKEREHYSQTTERRRQYLYDKLTPQWSDRDEVKQKLGKERWKNNPNPKRDYAIQREENEKELRAIEEAMDRLDFLKSTLEGAYQRSRAIYQSATGQDDAGERQGAADKSNRYNDVRPNYRQARVSIADYPDPVDYGWTFTGSIEASLVEFFEKIYDDVTGDGGSTLVKLDWYYTTGTIKTSLDHPTRGPNQLFGKQVSPEEYIQILLNPRAHTNVRYRTKGSGRGTGQRGRGREPRGSNGRGRGTGRGRGPGGERGGTRRHIV